MGERKRRRRTRATKDNDTLTGSQLVLPSLFFSFTRGREEPQSRLDDTRFDVMMLPDFPVKLFQIARDIGRAVNQGDRDWIRRCAYGLLPLFIFLQRLKAFFGCREKGKAINRVQHQNALSTFFHIVSVANRRRLGARHNKMWARQ